jgi:LemA protein
MNVSGVKMTGIVYIVGIVIFIFLGFIYIYNSLITLKNRIDDAWAQIDVQVKKRADLVPNLVGTVKGYAAHERDVLEKVTEARSAVMKAASVKEAAGAQDMLTGALKSLFAVAENYPDLKASQNFLSLQEELSGIEGKIAYARQFYNDSVMAFNTKIEKIPANIVAGILGYKAREYFEIKEAEKAVPKVEF